MGRWTPLEKKSLALALGAVVLWSTDFIHHISPSAIALGAGLLCVMPFMRILEMEDLHRVNFMQLFYVAAAIGMGNVLSATKALSILTNALIAGVGPLLNNSFLAPLALYWTGFVYHLFLGSEISMLATSTPVLMNFAAEHGLNPLKLGMLWVFASSGKIFVYQSAVLLAGYSYGYFRSKDVFIMGLLMSIVDSLALLLLAPYYWPLIGIL